MRESHCNSSRHYRNRWVGLGVYRLGVFLFFQFHNPLTRRVDSLQIRLSKSSSQLPSLIATVSHSPEHLLAEEKQRV